jgi:hypothetical protein
MSRTRIELTEYDRQTIERARDALAASRALWADTTTAPSRGQLAYAHGRLEAAMWNLLRVIDEGADGGDES